MLLQRLPDTYQPSLDSSWTSAAGSQGWQQAQQPGAHQQHQHQHQHCQQRHVQRQLVSSSSSTLVPCSSVRFEGFDQPVDVQQRAAVPLTMAAPVDHQHWTQQTAASWLGEQAQAEAAPPAHDPLSGLAFSDDTLGLLSSFEECLLGLEDAFVPGTAEAPVLLRPQDAGSQLLQQHSCEPPGASPGSTPTFAGSLLPAMHSGVPHTLQQQQQEQHLTEAGPLARPFVRTGSSGGPSTCGLHTIAAPAPVAPPLAPEVPPAPPAEGDAQQQPPRRKRGRPRLYDTEPPATAMPSAAQPSPSSHTDGGASTDDAGQPAKRGRGPKPKYVFSSQQEALGARRERNRKAALESYYRKKEKTALLEAERARLQEENDALRGLLAQMEASGACPLLEATEAGIDLWLATSRPAE